MEQYPTFSELINFLFDFLAVTVIILASIILLEAVYAAKKDKYHPGINIATALGFLMLTVWAISHMN